MDQPNPDEQQAQAQLARVMQQLRELQTWLEAYDSEIDAPGGNESEARPPEGDDYNEVVQHLRRQLGAILQGQP